MINLAPPTSDLDYLKREYLPRVLPPTWSVLRESVDGTAYEGSRPRLRVIATFEKHLDTKTWLHVSVSRQDKIPDWDDLVWVKELFIGAEKTALQVLAPRSQWVNQHKYCLHLWHCLDADVTPDFTQGGDSL